MRTNIRLYMTIESYIEKLMEVWMIMNVTVQRL
jgi:hypothetical protein